MGVELENTKAVEEVEPIRANVRIIKFLLVGGSSVAVEYSIFLLLHYALNINVSVANVISFSGGFIYSFLMNRGLVFVEGKQSAVHRQIIMYFVLALVNLCVSTALVTVLSYLIPAYIAKILCSGLIAAYNYVIYRKVIFK